jgi:hypothetical protein
MQHEKHVLESNAGGQAASVHHCCTIFTAQHSAVPASSCVRVCMHGMHLGILVQWHAAAADANEDAVRLGQVVDLYEPQVHSADEALVTQHRTIVTKDFRHLLHDAPSHAQVAAASFSVPFKVQLLQLGDVDQAGLQVLVCTLRAAAATGAAAVSGSHIWHRSMYKTKRPVCVAVAGPDTLHACKAEALPCPHQRACKKASAGLMGARRPVKAWPRRWPLRKNLA